MNDRQRSMRRAVSVAAVSGLALTAVGWQTAAQTPARAAAPAGAAGPTYGPSINGVCVFSRKIALDRSQAGQSAGQQLAQFAQSAKSELGAQKAAIQADDRALAQRKGSTPPAEFQQSVTVLRQRYAALDRAARGREAQLAQTARDAERLVGQALVPALNEAITQRRCALVIEAGGLYGANPAMDITGSVIQAMNQRLSSVTVRLAQPASQSRP